MLIRVFQWPCSGKQENLHIRFVISSSRNILVCLVTKFTMKLLPVIAIHHHCLWIPNLSKSMNYWKILWAMNSTKVSGWRRLGQILRHSVMFSIVILTILVRIQFVITVFSTDPFAEFMTSWKLLTVKSWKEFEAFIPGKKVKAGHVHDPSRPIEVVKATLDKIKGHLVIFPTQFLEKVELHGLDQIIDDLVLTKAAI